jgi:hypothetical protein
MTFPILGGNGAVAGYSIDNSLRFNSGDSPILARTPSSAGDGQKFTYSTWFKRSEFGVEMSPFLHSGSNASNYFRLRLDSGNTISSFSISGGSTDFNYVTTQVFRDPSAWYHLVFAVDTTNGTAANRVRFYINGSEITSFSTESNPSQNLSTDVNGTTTHYIGRRTPGNDSFYDGYLAETQLVDGQQLSPTDFGEFDSDSGIWKPIQYTGTYGTNGFYLDFENSGSLGADQSGNGNNFTPTNLASTDQTTDTPTNNFCTWNINNVNPSSTNTFSEGNLKCTSGGAIATFAMPSGKWYWEVRCNNSDADQAIGIISVTEGGQTSISGSTNPTHGFLYQANGNARRNGTVVETWSTFTNGDIIGFAYDSSTRILNAYKNNSFVGDITVTDSGDSYAPIVTDLGGNFIANFGQEGTFAGNETAQGNADGNGYGNFYYSPPSGYLALCTQNLATALSPTIDDGSQYFNTKLYSGNSTTNPITGVGFAPDFTWLKARNYANAHFLLDTTRGSGQVLFSSSTSAETDFQGTRWQSFDSDGFTLTGSDSSTNISGGNYVTWNWKANGGTTSSNTDGSITSTVQANTTAGFSIVTYTGTGSAGTVGHGLGSTVAMVITKSRDSASSWQIYHKDLGKDKTMQLEQTASTSTITNYWGTSTPNSTVFGVIGGGYNNNLSGQATIAYCFAEIEGYSKFGSYTGNGSTDGTFVYTGFRPAWVLAKRYDSTGNWVMHDNKRNGFNVDNDMLIANLSNAESDVVNLDLLSNGFKWRNSSTGNQSGANWIYMAFAESPFVSSSGVPVVAR